jgi:hypothetical protein
MFLAKIGKARVRRAAEIFGGVTGGVYLYILNILFI